MTFTEVKAAFISSPNDIASSSSKKSTNITMIVAIAVPAALAVIIIITALLIVRARRQRARVAAAKRVMSVQNSHPVHYYNPQGMGYGPVQQQVPMNYQVIQQQSYYPNNTMNPQMQGGNVEYLSNRVY